MPAFPDGFVVSVDGPLTLRVNADPVEVSDVCRWRREGERWSPH